VAQTLIRSATIIAGSTEAATDELADILIDGDQIVAVGRDLVSADAEIVDGSGRIILPGFVNAHQHTWQTALRGISYDWTLLEYLQRVHGSLASRFTPEDIHIGTLVGALNQIDCGTTTLGDWCHNNPTHEHTDAALDALEASGIRSVFLHGTPPLKPGASGGPTKHPKDELQRLLARFPSGNGNRLNIGMAIPGPLYSPLEVALADSQLALDFGVVVSFHHSGGVPADEKAWVTLEEAGLLGPHTNIVHGNHIDDDLLKRLVDSGVSFTVTPEVEMSDGHGDPITGRLRALGGAPSIGIDIETAISGDMLTATRMALAHQRALDYATVRRESGSFELRSPIEAREALAWATIYGAHALGLSDSVGSLEPGKQADLIVIDARALNLWPVHDPVATALQAKPSNIEGVMIAGKWQKRNGRLTHANIASLQNELAESAERVTSESP